MAEIKPFRAWRYNTDLLDKIDLLTSPLFDVVSEKYRKKLYEEDYNSIHLSVPKEDDPEMNVAKTLTDWKEQGVIQQDELPAFYIYYQYFTLSGEDTEYCRKGFISYIKLYDWDENVLLRHENTMPFSVKDRMSLLDRTQLHVSPTHGLYSDPVMEIEKYLDEAMRTPLYETEDYQGVRDVFGVIHDVRIIKRITDIISGKKIILADGHHRYESSLLYQQQHRKNNAAHTGKEAYNYHMMYLTNTETDDLRILPTHRMVKSLHGFSKGVFLERLEKYFKVKQVEDPTDINEIVLGKKWTFGLLFHDSACCIRLKSGMTGTMERKFSDTIKELDLTVMHYFIFEKCLGMSEKEQRSNQNLFFERNFAKCLKQVLTEEAQCAIITEGISIETVKKVCYSGHILPQKSTCFYPKVICGFLFGSLREEEF